MRADLRSEFLAPSGELFMSEKIVWSGVILAVQPRIMLTRSFDERTHSYLGYLLRTEGAIGLENRQFLVAVGKAAHAKHQFHVGDSLCGVGASVADPHLEAADLYKVSRLKFQNRAAASVFEPPPWLDLAPDLETYRHRGWRHERTSRFQGIMFSDFVSGEGRALAFGERFVR